MSGGRPVGTGKSADKVMAVLEVAKRLDITEIGLATKRAQ